MEKQSKKPIKKIGAVIGAAIFSIVAGSSIALANPTGGSVISGGAVITQVPNYTEVQQSTDKAIINWESFSIDKQEHTHFQQPDSGSIALNRVIGSDPSAIFGRLSANGRLMLINSAGILFGPSSRVDVAGLIASTADITDDDFLNDRYRFIQAPGTRGSVINQGQIKVADEGLVALVGIGADNQGIIEANMGHVILAAGQEFSFDTIDLHGDGLINFGVNGENLEAGWDENGNPLNYAVSNSGTIKANGGKVLLAVQVASGVVENAINMDGIIEANTVVERNGEIVLLGGPAGNVSVGGTLQAMGDDPDEFGGMITVTGEHVDLVDDAVIDVKGDSGGGVILVGGDFQGKGDLPRSQSTTVSEGVVLVADAVRTGDGGTIIVWSDGDTKIYGTLSATGGALSGDGGFVETSGKTFLGIVNIPDLQAFNGEAGTWLIDPDEIKMGFDFFIVGDGFAVLLTLINNTLNEGFNLTLIADNTITQSNNATIEKEEGGDSILTFAVGERMELEGEIINSSDTGTLDVVLCHAEACLNRITGTSEENSFFNIHFEPGLIEISGDITLGGNGGSLTVNQQGNDVLFRSDINVDGAFEVTQVGDGDITFDPGFEFSPFSVTTQATMFFMESGNGNINISEDTSFNSVNSNIEITEADDGSIIGTSTVLNALNGDISVEETGVGNIQLSSVQMSISSGNGNISLDESGEGNIELSDTQMNVLVGNGNISLDESDEGNIELSDTQMNVLVGNGNISVVESGSGDINLSTASINVGIGTISLQESGIGNILTAGVSSISSTNGNVSLQEEDAGNVELSEVTDLLSVGDVSIQESGTGDILTAGISTLEATGGNVSIQEGEAGNVVLSDITRILSEGGDVNITVDEGEYRQEDVSSVATLAGGTTTITVVGGDIIFDQTNTSFPFDSNTILGVIGDQAINFMGQVTLTNDLSLIADEGIVLFNAPLFLDNGSRIFLETSARVDRLFLESNIGLDIDDLSHFVGRANIVIMLPDNDVKLGFGLAQETLTLAAGTYEGGEVNLDIDRTEPFTLFAPNPTVTLDGGLTVNSSQLFNIIAPVLQTLTTESQDFVFNAPVNLVGPTSLRASGDVALHEGVTFNGFNLGLGSSITGNITLGGPLVFSEDSQVNFFGIDHLFLEGGLGVTKEDVFDNASPRFTFAESFPETVTMNAPNDINLGVALAQVTLILNSGNYDSDVVVEDEPFSTLIANGGVTLNSLTLNHMAPLTLSGTFSADDTNLDGFGIEINGPIELSGETVFTSAAGDIVFNNTINEADMVTTEMSVFLTEPFLATLFTSNSVVGNSRPLSSLFISGGELTVNGPIVVDNGFEFANGTAFENNADIFTETQRISLEISGKDPGILNASLIANGMNGGIRIDSEAGITQTGGILVAPSLVLQQSGTNAGNFIFTQIDNDIGTLTANIRGNLTYLGTNDLVIGTDPLSIVSPGITTKGRTTLGLEGDITVEAPILSQSGMFFGATENILIENTLEALNEFIILRVGSGDITVSDGSFSITSGQGISMLATNGGISLSSPINAGTSIFINAGSVGIILNDDLHADSDVILLQSGNGVTQNSGAITGPSLVLLGGPGDFDLVQVNNDIGTLVADIDGSLDYLDATGVRTGTFGNIRGVTTTEDTSLTATEISGELRADNIFLDGSDGHDVDVTAGSSITITGQDGGLFRGTIQGVGGDDAALLALLQPGSDGLFFFNNCILLPGGGAACFDPQQLHVLFEDQRPIYKHIPLEEYGMRDRECVVIEEEQLLFIECPDVDVQAFEI